MRLGQFRVWAAAAALLAASLAPAFAAGASDWFNTDQGRVRLVAAEPFVGDDTSVELGLEFDLQPGWKIYWRSPGDAGYPPRLDWAGSTNLAAATLAWPAPRRFTVLGLETMGYEDHVVLPIHATVSKTGTGATLHAKLDYLTCAEICVPYEAQLALDLPAGPAPGQGFGPLIAEAEAQVPGDGAAAGLSLERAVMRDGTPASLDLWVKTDRPLDTPDAFVEGAGAVSFAKPATRIVSPDEAVLSLPAQGAGGALGAVAGKRLAITLVDGARAMSATVAPARGAPALDWAALLPMLGVALLGGLILNAMPCVLPVLSLKLLAAVEHRGETPQGVRISFLATALGIVLSFAVLAAATIAAAATGHGVGWGVQFQSPWFLAAMATLVTLFAANLWDMIDIRLPAAIADRAGRASIGNVATGAFATLLATPCSAPFLGTAVGFALAAGPAEIVAIFLALGVGFAAPYLAVAAFPRLARLLPRPGRWMVTLRGLLGIALIFTAMWLVWVLGAESGVEAAAALTMLLLVLIAALGVVPAGAARAGVASALVAAALVTPLLAMTPEAGDQDAHWRPFDPAALGPLVRDGNVVLVDVTADWCLTCKVNERLVLASDAIRERLDGKNVVAMRADWTRPDPAIAEYLKRFGRYGIPFNAVYGPGAPAGVALPELLTEDSVLAALKEAHGG